MTGPLRFAKPVRRMAAMVLPLCGVTVAALTLTACQQSPLSTRSDRLDAYVARNAQTAEDNRDHTTALKHYASLRESDPGNVVAITGLARNLRNLGRHDEAVKVVEEALAQQKNPPGALLLEHGRSLLAAGQAEKALQSLKKAAEADSKDWRIPNVQGIAADRLSRPEEAETSYRRALALSPDNPEILNNLGLSRALAGNLDDGLALVRQAAAHPAARTATRENARENIRLLESLRQNPKGAAAKNVASGDKPATARGRRSSEE